MEWIRELETQLAETEYTAETRRLVAAEKRKQKQNKNQTNQTINYT